MLDVKILGTSGSRPLPNRHLAAAFVRTNVCKILFDCGEGTQIACTKSNVSINSITTICFTHLHADHVLGLGGLLATMNACERTEPLLIIGPVGIKDFFIDQLRIVKNLKFDVRCFELIERKHEFQFEDCKLTAFKVKHGVATYGYTIDVIQAPAFNVEKAEGYGIPNQFWEAIAKDIDFEFNNTLITRETFLGKNRKRLRVSYVTDTAYTDSIIKYCNGADILILEGMYSDKYVPAELSDKMHLTFREAGTIANAASANILCLTHFCSRIVRPKANLKEATNIHKNTICGSDGLNFTLTFNSDSIIMYHCNSSDRCEI